MTTNCLPTKELETSCWIKTLPSRQRSLQLEAKKSQTQKSAQSTWPTLVHSMHSGRQVSMFPWQLGHNGQKHSTFNKIHFHPEFCIKTHFSLLEIPLNYQAYSDLFLSAWNSPFINSSSGFPGGTVIKNLPANAGDERDVDLIPGSGRSPGVGNGNPL